MKVCFVVPHFYPHIGGGEKAMLDYIIAMKKYNIQVRVLTSSSGGVVGHKEYEGIDIYYYDWKVLFGHPLVRRKDLIEHIEWADIVHAAVYSPVRTTSSVCKKLNKPLIITVYESLNEKWYWIEENKIKALMFRIYEKMVLNSKCDYYHTISGATTNDLMKNVKKNNIKQIYTVVEMNKNHVEYNREKLNSFFGVKSDDRIFLSYGRPGKTKGIFIYLGAIKQIVLELSEEELKHTKFCFIMANDPLVQKQKFLKEVEKNNLGKYVIVKDPVERNDLETYIKSCDYVVVPSITEGFGLSAVEACEMGTKIIHSTGGSLPEVTFGDVLEFENRNSAALGSILKDVIFGKANFMKKERKDFSSETIGKEMYSLYEMVLKNRRNVK